MLSFSTCCAGKNTCLLSSPFLNCIYFTPGEFMHKELKQISLRKKPFFFSIPASESYFREPSLHRPESYILPMCLSACSHAACTDKTGSFLVQRPVLLIGERRVSHSFGCSSSPPRFSLKGQRSGSHLTPSGLLNTGAGEDAESPLGLVRADRGIECPAPAALHAAPHARGAVAAETRSLGGGGR